MATGNTSSFEKDLLNLEKTKRLLENIYALKKRSYEQEWINSNLLSVQNNGLDAYLKRISGITETLQNNVDLQSEEKAALKEILDNKLQEAQYQKKLNELQKESEGVTGKLRRTGLYLNENIKAASALIKTTVSESKKLADSWIKIQDASSAFAKNIGIGQTGMKKIADQTLQNVVGKKIGIKYNISTEDLIKLQGDVIGEIGRNIKIYDNAQESLAAMDALMKGGEKDFLSRYENFALGFEDTEKRIGGMFQKAAKNGLSFSKYSDNVKQNIAIAQNYTFKNGLRGLESMALKSTAIRMDMQMIASFADKVNSVEGSLETAAKLQVLGGPFASFADPLGMLNESLNDMEGLFDRVSRMVGGLGSFDRATGEVRVSAFNKQRVRAAAEAMGMDYGKLMESIQTQAKRREIDRELSAGGTFSNLTEEQRELLRNTAMFQNGVAGVSINGSFKKLNEINGSDLTILAQETQDISADVKDIAKSLRSVTDIFEGTRKQREARLANGIGGKVGAFLKNVVNSVGMSNFWLASINALLVAQSFGAIGKSGWELAKKTGIGSKWKAGNFGRKEYGSAQVAGQNLIQAVSNIGGGTIAKGATSTASKAVAKDGIERIVMKNGKVAFRNAVTKKFVSNAVVDAALAGGSLAGTGAAGGGGIAAVLGTELSIPVAGWIAAAVTAVAVGTTAAVKAAQKKRDQALTNELNRMGISKQGKYSAHKLKLIEEALHTGELTGAARRKILREGDYQLLDEIDRVAKERGVSGVRRRGGGVNGKINEARFTVTNAYFEGEAIKSNNGVTITGGYSENGSSPVLSELKRIGNLIEYQVTGGNGGVTGNLSPKIELNLGGSIRLTTDGGVTRDIANAIVQSPEFRDELIRVIQRSLNGVPSQNSKYSSGTGT